MDYRALGWDHAVAEPRQANYPLQICVIKKRGDQHSAYLYTRGDRRASRMIDVAARYRFAKFDSRPNSKY